MSYRMRLCLYFCVQSERRSRESLEQSLMSLKSDCEAHEQRLYTAQEQLASLTQQLHTSHQVNVTSQLHQLLLLLLHPLNGLF